MNKMRFLLPILPIVLGALVLVGWILDIHALRQGVVQSVSMNPVVAVGFVLLGLELLRLYSRMDNLWVNRICHLAIWTVIIAAAMKLSDLTLNTSFVVDQMLFSNRMDNSLLRHNGMAPNTAVCLFLSGSAMQLMRSKENASIFIAQSLAAITALIALLAIVGYLYGIQEFYAMGVYVPMAFNTAIAFIFLSLASLFAYQNKGYMRVFSSNGPAGKTSIILLPAALTVPIIFGWITLSAHREGLFDVAVDHAIFAILNVTAFFWLSYISVRNLYFSDLQRQKGEVGLRDSAARINTILDTIIDGVITIDEFGIVESFNPAAVRVFGYEASEVIGNNVKMLMPEPYCGQHDGYLEHYRVTGVARTIGTGREAMGKRKNGNTFPLDIALNEMWLNGRRHFTAIVRDITDRKRAEEQLHSASLYSRSLIEASLDPLAIINMEANILDVNEAMVRVTGIPRGRLIGSDLAGYFTDPEKGRAYYQEVISNGSVSNYPMVMEHVSGKLTDVLYNAGVYRNERGEIAGILVKARDITERKRAEQAEELASRDGLTGLYNHRTFLSMLNEEIARAERYNHPLSLLMLDIDYFKHVNDTWGHLSGDAVLKGLSDLLMKQARSIDRVCRYGGEEFTVILSETDVIMATTLAERLRKTVERQPFAIGDGKTIRITVSIGVATYSQQMSSAEGLVKASDVALYAAKGGGRNQVCRYEPETLEMK